MSKRTISLHDFTIGADKLTLFAGPCMAESLDICLKTAEYLQKLCAEFDVNYVFKASYDKANRSSGDSRRGPGLSDGLGMLAEVKARLDVPIITDVHDKEEVAPVSEVADVLQIPAFLCRQTDLLVAAGKSGRAVNVKKGQFMAPEDMAGAVNKVRATGNENILLTERGSSFGYHNLVVDMRSLVIMRDFEVPVVFDATHSVQLPGGNGNSSGGRPEFIAPLARAAAAIGIDVLFAEVHPNPKQALSDGANSLDFAGIRKVLQEVKAIHELGR